MSDSDLTKPRPYCDWHEDIGDVLWWRVPVCEPPYAGSPLDCGQSVVIQLTIGGMPLNPIRETAGGWPYGSDEHGALWWTPLPDGKLIEEQIPL